MGVPCPSSCLTDVCGCPSSKPYLNTDGWCVSYDTCIDATPITCPTNQEYYEYCAPRTRTCPETVESNTFTSCQPKTCACPQSHPFLVEGVCIESCPEQSLSRSVTVFVYRVVGSTVQLSPAEKIRKIRWYQFSLTDKISANTKFELPGSDLVIKNLGEADAGNYYAKLTTTTGEEVTYTYRVYPLELSLLYVWYEDNPLTVSSGLNVPAPLSWLKQDPTTQSLAPIENDVLYLQQTYGSLTFVNLQKSDAGQYHGVYLDPSTGVTTSSIVNVTVIPQPVLQTKQCTTGKECQISVGLYTGWKQVLWYTILNGAKQFVKIDGYKYKLEDGVLVISSVSRGDGDTYYGQVTYTSNENYVITYPWKVEVSTGGGGGGIIRPDLEGGGKEDDKTGDKCSYVEATSHSVCEATEDGNIELVIPFSINPGDQIQWYYTIDGVRYQITSQDGRYYIKQGGTFLEIGNLQKTDSGNYYVVVTYKDGSVDEISYDIVVEGAVKNLQDVGYDMCWDAESGNGCMGRGSECAWCADEVWDNYRCLTYYSTLTEGCSNLINYQPSQQVIENVFVGSEYYKATQITPMKVKAKMRPGQCTTIPTLARATPNYPIDLMILQQQTPSTLRTKFNAAIKDIVIAMGGLANTTNFGYGAFADRDITPFVVEWGNGTENTCLSEGTCGESYAFKMLNYLDDNDKIYESIIDTMVTNTTNKFDEGNSAMDAIYQSLACDQFGWRYASNKMVLVVLSSDPRVGGDGQLAGMVEPFDKKCNTGVKVNTDMIKEMIPGAKIFGIGDLGSLDLKLEEYYKELVEFPTMNQVVIPEGVSVNYTCYPTADSSARCENVAAGTELTYQVTVCADRCLNDTRGDILLNFPAYGQLGIELETMCTIDLPVEPDSTKCNGNGSYQGGACFCNEGWVGDKCGCAMGSHGLLTQCINPKSRSPNAKPECSNRGECQCGKCKCQPLRDVQSVSISNNPLFQSYGKYCQYDHLNCPKGIVRYGDSFKVEACSDRGTCVKEKCVCYGTYTGEACQYSNDACLSVVDICTTCEDYERCASCIFDKGESKCLAECSSVTTNQVTSISALPSSVRECTIVVNDCLYYFYHTTAFYYLSSAKDDCLTGAAIGAATGGGVDEGAATGAATGAASGSDDEEGMGIILALGIIFGILLLGVFLLICCKCCCCKPNSALMKACPCLATLAKAFSAHCMCDCCKGGADKSENEVTLGKNSKVVDNPIYEPKDKQEPADAVIPTPADPTGPGEIARPDDQAQPLAKREDVPELENEKPLSQVQDGEDVADGSVPESGAMAPMEAGEDTNPHSMADIESIVNDTPLSGDMGSGDMSLTKMGPDTDLQGGVITPPIPTESIQGFKVGSGSVIDEPAAPTKGGGNTLAPRDWAGNEQEKSQMSFDPDDNDFDVDFDQVQLVIIILEVAIVFLIMASIMASIPYWIHPIWIHPIWAYSTTP
eukprot:sb/3460908/